MPFNIHDGRTDRFYDAISKCEDIDDIHLLFDKYSDYFVSWKNFINYLLDSSGCTYTEFAELCGMSRNTIISWCERGQLPRSRKQFIQIGFAVRMNLNELNDFLMRYGKYPKLNAKNIDDAVTIFALSNGLSFQQSVELKRHFSSVLRDILNSRRQGGRENIRCLGTEQLESELLSVSTIMEFERFVEQNVEAFADCYAKLLDFIDSYVAMNTTNADGSHGTLNSFLSECIDNPATAASFNTMISKLRRYGTIPSRISLIALGIHMRMTADDLNTMLTLSGMEKLCARDKLESLIIFAAENAVVQNPGIEFSNALMLRQFTKNPEIKSKCDKIIERYGMTDYLCNDNVDLYDYITESLMTMDSDSTNEILHLLGKN
ncbi:MAG: helix-turn-helix domain-containing protein [Acutalibacteraceae bacterium]